MTKQVITVVLELATGTFRLRDVIVNPQELQQQIVTQNIRLDADVIQALLNASINATTVKDYI